MLNDYSAKLVSTGLDKQLTTYNFNSSLVYNFQASNLFFGLKENFTSSISKSVTKNIKDEQFLSMIGEYQFIPSIKLGMYLNNSIYSDDRKLSINKASNLSGTIYLKISPTNNLIIVPYGGYSNNEQIGEKDQGYLYGIEAFTPRYKLSDFEINSSIKFQNEDISPRKNTMRLININISNVIEKSLFNTATAFYNEQRKDFYFETDSLVSMRFNVKNNLQSRIESNYYLQDRIFYTSGISGISIDVQGRVSWRNIDRETRYIIPGNITTSSFDSRIEEFIIDLTSAAEYRTDSFIGQFKLSLNEREEKHFAKRIEEANEIIYNDRVNLENQKNNSSQQTNISLSGRYKFDNKNSLLLSVLHRKLIYDTPSDDNYDDRDELLSIFRVMYIRKFSPFFNMFINIEGSTNHIVYIFAERSSNNNIRRIIKLSSGGNYSGPEFSSNNSVEVTANYTVYDFEELSANLKSFSFRQFAFRDSTSFTITRKTGFQFISYLKLSEQGDFKWSNFSSRPVRFIEEAYLEPQISYSILGLKIAIGLRYFSLTTYGYNSTNDKMKLSDYKSIGPLTEITILRDDKLDLRIYGWYEFITTEDNSKRELANLSMKLNWNL